MQGSRGRKLSGFGLLAGLVLLAIVAPSGAGAASPVSPPAPSTRIAKGATQCGTKELYGHSLRIVAKGKVADSCRKVRRIIDGSRCRRERRWLCFSFWVPGPVLAWFPFREIFEPRLSSLIVARRYPCSEAVVTNALWTAPTRPFPTRRQVLADDIIRCELFRGLETEQVAALLGEPSSVSIDSRDEGYVYWDYPLGPERDSIFQIDGESLSIRFKPSGRVGRIAIYQT